MTSISDVAVEAAFEQLERVRRFARTHPVEEVEALAERIRVELILNKSIRRPGRRFYRDVLDYLDVVVDERHSEQGTDRESLRHTVLAYVRGMIEDKEPE